MRKFILPAVLAAVAALAFLPSHAQASWLSEALHQSRGDYNYGYAPGYSGSPVYSGYYSPGYNYTPNYSYYPPSNNYAPPVYYYTPRYQYAPYGNGRYPSYYPQYRNEGRGHDQDRDGNHDRR